MANIIINLGDTLNSLSDLYATFRTGETDINTVTTGFTNMGDGVYSLSATVPEDADNVLIGSTAEGVMTVIAVSPPAAESDAWSPVASGFAQRCNVYIPSDIDITYELRLIRGSNPGNEEIGEQHIVSPDHGYCLLLLYRQNAYLIQKGDKALQVLIEDGFYDPYLLAIP